MRKFFLVLAVWCSTSAAIQGLPSLEEIAEIFPQPRQVVPLSLAEMLLKNAHDKALESPLSYTHAQIHEEIQRSSPQTIVQAQERIARPDLPSLVYIALGINLPFEQGLKELIVHSLPASINKKDEEGDNALGLALVAGAEFRVIQCLCDAGADVQDCNAKGQNAFYLAATSRANSVGDKKMILELLAARGSNINKRTNNRRNTLFDVVRTEPIADVLSLLSCNVGQQSFKESIIQRDRHGHVVLTEAVSRFRAPVTTPHDMQLLGKLIEVLLQEGAAETIHRADGYIFTPFYKVLEYGMRDTLLTFLEWQDPDQLSLALGTIVECKRNDDLSSAVHDVIADMEFYPLLMEQQVVPAFKER